MDDRRKWTTFGWEDTLLLAGAFAFGLFVLGGWR
jgi:hypothetical protein